MTEADLVITVGRRLDYQLGYGSPAVFPRARFVRISDTASELIDNRRGDAELLATPVLALDAIAEAGAGLGAPQIDRDWAEGIRARHVARASGGNRETPQTGADGKIHPMAIFDVLKQLADPDCITVADGGDLLSFARVGWRRRPTWTQARSGASAWECPTPTRPRWPSRGGRSSA